MRHYEINFIVDPLLTSDEVKGTADMYATQLKSEGCEIVHTYELGLKQLAYPIKKRNSGTYYCIQVSAPDGKFIDKLEIGFRRDERVLRFLTIALDKYGIKYNDDLRAGVIGKRKRDREAAAVKAKAEAELGNAAEG